MSSARIILDTREAAFSSSPADANWVFGQSFSNDQDTYNVLLSDASIPNVQFPIVTGRNDSLVFRENGGSTNITATLSSKKYSADQLASEIATKMTAASGIAATYSASYDAQTFKLTISSTSTFVIHSSSTCLAVIGYAAFTTFASSKTGDYPVDVSGARYVDVEVGFPTNSYEPNGRSNVLARLYFDTPIGNIFVWRQYLTFADPVTVTAQSLQNFRIRLVDDQGYTYAIPANLYCTFTLIIK